ncbi:unnamed protein product [Caenorhabditis nigoni]
MRKEYLSAINEFASFSESLRDFKINIDGLEYQNDCNAVLSDKFFVAKNGSKWSVQFKLINPREKNTPTDTVEEMEHSVLENSKLMALILKQLECFDIERLRKVNRGVRKCIDEVKPEPHIEKYSISFDLRPRVLPLTQVARIELESSDFKKVSYEAQDGTSLCLNDFETTLKHQNSCMEQLSIVFQFTTFERFHCCIGICKEIGDILKRREQPLKTRKFSMAYGCQLEMKDILQAIDKDSLKTIEFVDPSEPGFKAFFGLEVPFEVDQLSQTDQWKNAEHLIIQDLAIPASIQDINILHFSNLEVLVKTLSSQDVDYLRTNLLKSSSFQKFKISFRESTIDESSHELIGEPFCIISDSKKIWYFRMENGNFYIHIVLDTSDVKNIYRKLKPKMIIFTKVAKEDTPFF